MAPDACLPDARRLDRCSTAPVLPEGSIGTLERAGAPAAAVCISAHVRVRMGQFVRQHLHCQALHAHAEQAIHQSDHTPEQFDPRVGVVGVVPTRLRWWIEAVDAHHVASYRKDLSQHVCARSAAQRISQGRSVPGDHKADHGRSEAFKPATVAINVVGSSGDTSSPSPT